MAETFNIEKNLILRIVDGDQQAFADLYDMYADKLYYFSLRFLKSKEDAENLCQEVFLKIWETRDRLNIDYSFNAYLFTIARNTIFNIHRKKLNEQAFRDYLINHGNFFHSKTEQDVFFNDLNEKVNACIETLPSQRKKVFELSRKDGLSHKEISLQLNISEKTIETHIRLALKTIREMLDEAFPFLLFLFFEMNYLIL